MLVCYTIGLNEIGRCTRNRQINHLLEDLEDTRLNYPRGI